MRLYVIHLLNGRSLQSSISWSALSVPGESGALPMLGDDNFVEISDTIDIIYLWDAITSEKMYGTSRTRRLKKNKLCIDASGHGGSVCFQPFPTTTAVACLSANWKVLPPSVETRGWRHLSCHRHP